MVCPLLLLLLDNLVDALAAYWLLLLLVVRCALGTVHLLLILLLLSEDLLLNVLRGGLWLLLVLRLLCLYLYRFLLYCPWQGTVGGQIYVRCLFLTGTFIFRNVLLEYLLIYEVL